MLPHEILTLRWGASGDGKAVTEDADTVGAFTARHAVVLPTDFRAYLLNVDKRLYGKYDFGPSRGGDLYCFWHLEELTRVQEECPGYTGFEDGAPHFVFCDFLIWSNAYAICLAPDKLGLVTGILARDVCHPVAESFTAFIEAYLADPGRMIG
jgi:hypothetical protein